MTPVGLTPRQRELLAFIAARLANGGVSPSFEEMRKHLGLASRSTVHRFVEGLVERGHIVRLPNRWRTIVLPDQAPVHPPEPVAVETTIPRGCLDLSRRRLAGIAKAWERGEQPDEAAVSFLIRMAEQRLGVS